MMKPVIIAFFIFFNALICNAQDSDSSKQDMHHELIKIRQLGKTMVGSQYYERRRDANYAIIRHLTEFLKQENSFQLSLDSISFISVREPADHAFRILTWQLETSAGMVRHYGAIQMNTKQLTLIPLVDRSDDIENPETYVGDNEHWFGAIYYQVQAFNTNKGKAYLLYGFDANTPFSNKKILDILYISKTGDKLLFGGPIFPSFSNPKKQATRFILEYKEDAASRLNFDEELKQVVFDHLVPMDDESEGIYANYVPDGTYDALSFDRTSFYLVKDAIKITPQVFKPTDSNPNVNSDTIYNSNSKQ